MDFIQEVDKKVLASEGYRMLKDVNNILESNVSLSEEEVEHLSNLIDVAEGKINKLIDSYVVTINESILREYSGQKVILESLIALQEKGMGGLFKKKNRSLLGKLKDLAGKKKKTGLWAKLRKKKSKSFTQKMKDKLKLSPKTKEAGKKASIAAGLLAAPHAASAYGGSVAGLGLGLAGYGAARGMRSGWGHGKLAAEKSRKKAEKKGQV